MNNRARSLIAALELSPHPEGGYFREMYRSATVVHSPAADAARNALTDIYFLLQAGQISRFHRVLHDEIWHFYEGDALILLEFNPADMVMNQVVLSAAGVVPNYKHCVKGSNWQAASSAGAYSLVGCTVGPGFTFNDFQFLSDNSGLQTTFLQRFPQYGKFL